MPASTLPNKVGQKRPDNERWLHHPQALADLENALGWAKANPPSDEGVDRILAKLNDDA